MHHLGSLMSKKGVVFCFVVIFFSLVSSAKANTLTFTGATTKTTLNISDTDASPAYQNINAVIGPYTGILNNSSVILWCIDPDHQVSTGNQWPVYISQPANVINTYLKNATTYGEMAWLAMQFSNVTTATQKQALQAAIWSLAEGTNSGFTINVPTTNTAFWNYFNQDMTNAPLNVMTSGFVILTDVNGTKQEFMVLTPEPSTFVLFGVGLVAMILFAQWKKASPAQTRISGV